MDTVLSSDESHLDKVLSHAFTSQCLSKLRLFVDYEEKHNNNIVNGNTIISDMNLIFYMIKQDHDNGFHLSLDFYSYIYSLGLLHNTFYQESYFDISYNIVQYALKHQLPYEKLELLLQNIHPDTLKSLNNKDHSVLHTALYTKQPLYVFQLLLSFGADPNPFFRSYQPKLSQYSIYNPLSYLKHTLSSFSGSNIPTALCPLSLALILGVDFSIIALLLRSGADIRYKNMYYDGVTPIDLYCLGYKAKSHDNDPSDTPESSTIVLTPGLLYPTKGHDITIISSNDDFIYSHSILSLLDGHNDVALSMPSPASLTKNIKIYQGKIKDDNSNISIINNNNSMNIPNIQYQLLSHVPYPEPVIHELTTISTSNQGKDIIEQPQRFIFPSEIDHDTSISPTSTVSPVSWEYGLDAEIDDDDDDYDNDIDTNNNNDNNSHYKYDIDRILSFKPLPAISPSMMVRTDSPAISTPTASTTITTATKAPTKTPTSPTAPKTGKKSTRTSVKNQSCFNQTLPPRAKSSSLPISSLLPLPSLSSPSHNDKNKALYPLDSLLLPRQNAKVPLSLDIDINYNNCNRINIQYAKCRYNNSTINKINPIVPISPRSTLSLTHNLSSSTHAPTPLPSPSPSPSPLSNTTHDIPCPLLNRTNSSRSLLGTLSTSSNTSQVPLHSVSSSNLRNHHRSHHTLPDIVQPSVLPPPPPQSLHSFLYTSLMTLIMSVVVSFLLSPLVICYNIIGYIGPYIYKIYTYSILPLYRHYLLIINHINGNRSENNQDDTEEDTKMTYIISYLVYIQSILHIRHITYIYKYIISYISILYIFIMKTYDIYYNNIYDPFKDPYCIIHSEMALISLLQHKYNNNNQLINNNDNITSTNNSTKTTPSLSTSEITDINRDSTNSNTPIYTDDEISLLLRPEPTQNRTCLHLNVYFDKHELMTNILETVVQSIKLDTI